MTRGAEHTSTFIIKQNGKLSNADILPSVVIYINGVLTSVVVSVQFLTIGIYSYSFFVPESWEIGDAVDIHVSTMVNSFSIHQKRKEEITINTSNEMREIIISGLEQISC